MRLQSSPTNCGSAGAARRARLKLIGTRRKVLWVCAIPQSSPRSWVSASSQKKVAIANPEFSAVVLTRLKAGYDAPSPPHALMQAKEQPCLLGGRLRWEPVRHPFSE